MRPNIALVTGGYSGEAVISYRTADTVQQHLDPQRYQVYRIDIRTDGWWHQMADGRNIEVDKNDFSLHLDGVHVRFDAVFLAMHGTPGEDGKLQGYFDMIGLPYTSCQAATSAVTFNKRYATAIAGASGIPVARSIRLDMDSDRSASVQQVCAELRFPVFVKPNNGGSSIGMSKLNSPDQDLRAALNRAFAEDSEVLVEEMITGREFTVGVYRSSAGIQVLPITEVIADADQPFFDFEAKYQGKSTEVTPAQITDNVGLNLRAMAARVYEVFRCQGVVRIDFIYEATEDRPYMLEVNTIPGQSAASIIPQQVRAQGRMLKDFYSELIDATLNKKPNT